jgi:hypothetical protein
VAEQRQTRLLKEAEVGYGFFDFYPLFVDRDDHSAPGANAQKIPGRRGLLPIGMATYRGQHTNIQRNQTMLFQTNGHRHQVVTLHKRGSEGELNRMTGPYSLQQVLKNKAGCFIITEAKGAIPQIQMLALHLIIGRNDLVFLIDQKYRRYG